MCVHTRVFTRVGAKAGAIGFGCSLGFLLFVFKFNEYVQVNKLKH
jgi:hypothetical protein